MTIRALGRLAAAAAVLAILVPGAPARADDFGNFGWGFGTDMDTLSPLDASSILDSGLASADAGSLVSSFGLGSQYAQAYAVVADVAEASQHAIDSADIARQAQEVADQRRAAAAHGTDGQGCPTSAPGGTLRSGADSIGVYQLCADSAAAAATPQAAAAIKFAFRNLGAPYACGGTGRLDEFRFDCSSLVTRAYHEGAGLNTAGPGWAPTTRDLVPWGGGQLASWAAQVAPGDAKPGDLVLYDTGGDTYRHVVMLLADGYMLHTNACGDVAHVTAFWGYDSRFLVARRVLA